jgi:hypothetical protein
VLVEVSSGSALQDEKTNLDSSFVEKKRMRPAEKTHLELQKDESSFVHDLPFNSHDIPSHSGELGALGKLGAMIRGRIGDAKFHAWFRNAQIGNETGPVGILYLPTRFCCDYIRAQFEHEILECWRSFDPRKEKVELVVASRGAASRMEPSGRSR